MQAIQRRYYTPEEYLALEEAADYKSEYIDGEIIPMAGGTVNHNRITLNLSSELNFAFKQQDYEVFMSDIRLWIPEKRMYTYPDVMIISGKPEFFNNRQDIVINPRVIIEVLSKSTQDYDREDKFQAYRTISTFQEYLHIDQTQIRVEQYFKTGKKQWSLREYDAEDQAIAFNTVAWEISLADLYNKVKFELVESNVTESS
jgi:Uma2 family endonuclease